MLCDNLWITVLTLPASNGASQTLLMYSHSLEVIGVTPWCSPELQSWNAFRAVLMTKQCKDEDPHAPHQLLLSHYWKYFKKYSTVMDNPVLPIILCIAPAALILLSRHPLGLSLSKYNGWGWTEGNSVCYNPLVFMPTLLPLPSLSHSLMLSSSGMWNVVPGNKSIAMIISLYNRGTASLSECTSNRGRLV